MAHQCGQGYVHVGLQAGEGGDAFDEAGNDRWWLEQCQQRRCTRVAVGVEEVAETGEGLASGQVVHHHLLFAQALYLGEQGPHAARCVAMQRP